MKRFINYLHLRDVGLLELTFALTPMLGGFGLGGLPLSLFMWVLILVIVALQGKLNQAKVFKPLLYFVLYWFVHTIFILFVDNVNFNGIIAQIIYFMSVFVLYPIINIQKLRGSLNWVALLSIVGLLYQWTDIVRGGYVHPIEIPGLTMSEGRLLSESIRPSSFFMEPASYSGFMICPLFFALLERKYLWIVVLVMSIFLTTSTTGLILSFLMIGVNAIITGKAKFRSVVIAIVIGGGLLFALTRFSAFETSLDKLENTEVSTNIRLTQGRYIVSTMTPLEYVFGAPYYTVYNYCISGRAPDVVYYGDSVYMPTFWQMILLFGIVGLVLYLNIYLKILRSNKKSHPLILALCAVLFSSCYFIGGDYAFTLIILLVVARNISDTDDIKKMMVRI